MHLHVRGNKEEGTTPFDNGVMNDLDRFPLGIDMIERVPKPGVSAVYIKQKMRDRRIEYRQ